jgi:hypothetical protein
VKEGGMKRILVALLLFVTLAVCAQYYLGVGDPHYISKNVDGQYIILDDGSLWEVATYDQYETRIWLPVEEVIVVESKGPLSVYYPYRMINTDEEETAYVKLIKQ